VRGVTPEPGAFTTIGDARLKVHAASIAHDVPRPKPGHIEERGGRVFAGTATLPLELLEVQPAGKRAMPAADWWRGLDGSPVVAR
jgi:methionyl-tRNA formyltransferase